mmetsp:Transcript_90715/g.234233  ORF Transcript_90715/g.234233 Transcript_90715/m.234233 type:complete len:580 (-) Transcript_90715:70-1809(-)
MDGNGSAEFHEAVRLLQRAHEKQVAALRRDNVALRGELQEYQAIANGALGFLDKDNDKDQEEDGNLVALVAEPNRNGVPETKANGSLTVDAPAARIAAEGFARSASNGSPAALEDVADSGKTSEAIVAQRGGDKRQLTLRQAYSDDQINNPRFARSMSSVLVPESGTCRGRAQKMVLWGGFDIAIAIVICMNAGTIGIQAQLESQGSDIPEFIVTLENCFLCVYIFELVARFAAFGPGVFKSHWVKFDAFLVLCGCLDILVKVFAVPGSFGSSLENLMLLRILRLVRIVRVLRLMVQFRTLWLLVQGLMNSLMTLVWVLILISILLYVFAIVGMEFLHHDHETGGDLSARERRDMYNENVDRNFGNLGYTMLTLLQGLTLDSVGSIYRPIVLWRPWLLAYFISFILLVSIALMNLVTAIMVESALSQASEEKDVKRREMEAKQKRMIGKLWRLFRDLDADASGSLQLEELTSAPEEVQEVLREVTNSLDNNGDLANLFHLLDHDDCGNVEIEEFCDAMLQSSQGKSLEIICLLRQCRDILHDSRRTLELVTGLSASVQQLKVATGLAPLQGEPTSTLWC